MNLIKYLDNKTWTASNLSALSTSCNITNLFRSGAIPFATIRMGMNTSSIKDSNDNGIALDWSTPFVPTTDDIDSRVSGIVNSIRNECGDDKLRAASYFFHRQYIKLQHHRHCPEYSVLSEDDVNEIIRLVFNEIHKF